MTKWEPPDHEPDFLNVKVTCTQCGINTGSAPGAEAKNWVCAQCRTQVPLFPSGSGTGNGNGQGRKGRSIQERFEDFHEDNPHIYAHLVKIAREWKAAGHTMCGIGMLFEVLRWQRGLRTVREDEEDHKLCNDFRSRYARLIMEQEEDLDGLFVLRKLRTL